MGIITERLAILIEAKAGGAIKEFDSLSAKAAKADKDTGGLTGGMQKFGLSASSAAKVTAGLVVGVGIAAKFAQSSAKAFLDLATQVQGYKRVTGASAQDSSKLAAEFRRFGIDADTAQGLLFKFAKTIGTTPEKLKALGVEVAHNKSGTVDLVGTLRNLGAAYQGTNDATVRAALATTAFGKAGAAALPYLSATREQLDAIDRLAKSRGQILSDKDLQKAKDAKFAFSQLKEEIAGIKQSIGRNLFGSSKGEDFVQGLEVWRRNPLDGLKSLNPFAKDNKTQREVAQDFAQARTAQTAQEAADAEADLAAKGKNVIQVFLASRSAANAYADAQLGVRDASKSLADAQKTLSTFNKDYNAKLAQDRLDLKGATLGQAAAERTLVNAQRSVVTAQERLATLTVGAERQSLRQAAADRAAASARLNVKDATRALADAQKALYDLQHPTVDPSAQADADQNAREAAQQVAEAQAALDKAQGRAFRGEGDAADNAIDITRARTDLARATLDQQKAEQARTGTLGSAADAADKLAAAEDDVERARINLAEASAARDTAEQTAAGVAKQSAADIRAASDDVVSAKADVVTASFGVETAAANENAAQQKLADDESNRATLLADTVSKVVDARGKVTTANLNVQTAALAAADAQAALDDAVSDPAAITTAIKNLTPLVGKYSELRGVMNDLNHLFNSTNYFGLGSADALKQFIGTAPMKIPGVSDAEAASVAQYQHSLPRRALGGPTKAGQAYLVGENGVEVWQAGASGYMTPNSALRASGSTPSATVVHTHVILDGREVADVVTRHQRSMDRQGGDWRGRR
jgi:hypothetical protein